MRYIRFRYTLRMYQEALLMPMPRSDEIKNFILAVDKKLADGDSTPDVRLIQRNNGECPKITLDKWVKIGCESPENLKRFCFFFAAGPLNSELGNKNGVIALIWIFNCEWMMIFGAIEVNNSSFQRWNNTNRRRGGSVPSVANYQRQAVRLILWWQRSGA